MGWGIAAKTPPNFPAEDHISFEYCDMHIENTEINPQMLQALKYFPIHCTIACTSVSTTPCSKALTKNREKEHEKSSNLDHPTAPNSCESNESNIFTATR